MDDSERTVPHDGSQGPPHDIPDPLFVRYLGLLARHRVLLSIGSVLPALLVALGFHLWPQEYTATFVYERPLTEGQYSVLSRRFYSRENLDKIIDHLRERGLAQYAEKWAKSQTEQSFERLVQFQVSPMYPRRLQTTDPATSELISALEAQLLFIRVTGGSRDEVSAVAAVLTANFEDVLPLYAIRNDLKESIQQYKTLAAEIEEDRFAMQLDLRKEKARLAKLQAVEGAGEGETKDGLVLQFTEVEDSREFLPLSYQVRAVQSRIIDLEETLAADMERYRHYLRVLELDDMLLDKVEGSLLTEYTVQQYLRFLGEQLTACEDEALSDYLKSYTRRTENLVLVNTRAGERPLVYPLSKQVARNSVLALVVGLMVAAFVAVLLEYRDGRRRGGAGA